MTLNMAIALLAIMAAIVHANAMDFDCNTLLPKGLTEKDSLKNTAFQLEIIDSMHLPTNTFKAGGELTVILKGDLPIDTFVLQARTPLGDTPIGRWQTKDAKQTTFSCHDGSADTVTNAERVEVKNVVAVWIAPEDNEINEIEFVASVKNADGKFWYDFHSVLVEIEATPTTTPVANEEEEEGQSHYDSRENEEGRHNMDDEEEEEEGGREEEEEWEDEESRTGEDRNEEERKDEEDREEADARDAAGEAADREEAEGHTNDHGLANEEELAIQYAEKQQEMVEAEERTGEKWIGEAAREAAKVKKEMEEEKQSYERMRTLEETEREQRMDMERRDKEEFEEAQRLKGENEIDDSVSASSSGRAVATVYGAILAIVVALLL